MATVSEERRSDIMRQVKSENTQPEMQVRRCVHAQGFRYRLHDSRLPGKPDLVFSKHRLAVFVNGCFWHGHPCKRGARIPKTNQDYWKVKIERNRMRDRKAYRALRRDSWTVVVIWECQIEKGVRRLLRRLRLKSHA